MAEIVAVILAAGVSRRMGTQNKLLLPFGGKPIIRRTVEAYVEHCDEVVVVTGHEAEQVEMALAALRVKIVHNPTYRSGQATSVAAGLKAICNAECVLVGLGDQPHLRPEHIDALISAHLATGGRHISIPHDGVARGNPIVVPGALVGQMLADKQNPGCGKFTRRRPDLVNTVKLAARAFFDDVDTPRDYAALTSQLSQKEGVA